MKIIYSKEAALKEIQESPKEAKKKTLKSTLIISGCGALFASMLLFLLIESGFLSHSAETAMVSATMFICVFIICILLGTQFKFSPEDLYSFSTDYYLIIQDKKLLNTVLQQTFENEYSLKVTVANSEGLVTTHFIKGLTRRTKLGIDEHIVDLEKGVVYTPYTID